jgi:dinuclear metal center YbgI/SA1388 family protein
MKIKDIARAIEEFAPPFLAESYDNVGLLIGDPNAEATGVLINLDVTETLIDEAVAAGINLIVTHHPIWFTSLKRLNGENYVSRIIIKAVRQGVALYACHTNLDNIQAGVNRMIGERLGVQDMRILSTKRDPRMEAETGSGMIGELERPYGKEEFLALVKERFHCGGIRYADAPVQEIKRVAWCGGAGSFLISNALAAGADAFFTGDITYHKFFDNEDRILLLDIGHYESEQFTSNLLHSHLSKTFPTFAVRLSKIETNPVRYY